MEGMVNENILYQGRRMTPLILFVYRRPDHTRRVLESLALNPEAKDTEMIVFADCPKEDDTQTWELATKVCRTIQDFFGRFKSIEWHRSEEHLGLAESMRIGLTNVFSRYETAIVLEDDILVSQDFLKFMNEGLEYHRDHDYIFSLTGFCPKIDTSSVAPFDTFLYPRFWTLGWATWKNRFDSIQWDIKNPERFNRGGEDLNSMLAKVIAGETDAYGVKVCYAMRDRFTLFPRVSKVMLIGLDERGTNCRANLRPEYFTEISEEPLKFGIVFPLGAIGIQIDRMFRQSIIRKLINYVKYGAKP